METQKEVNPIVKQVLELGPPILFFVIYMRIRDETFTIAGTDYTGFIIAALIFVPILLLAMAILWALTGKLSRMQVFTAALVIIFGALTAWFNDERFFKMKTTLVYGLFAALLGIGLLRGQSWLQYILGDMVPMQDEGWMILTRRLCAAFATLAIGNEIIWRTMSTDAWVKIETFAFPVILMAFLMWQFTALKPYMIEEDEDEA